MEVVQRMGLSIIQTASLASIISVVVRVHRGARKVRKTSVYPVPRSLTRAVLARFCRAPQARITTQACVTGGAVEDLKGSAQSVGVRHRGAGSVVEWGPPRTRRLADRR